MAGCCRAATRRSCRSDSIAGRALVAVVAIMTFLASLTTGAVMLVRAAAGDWQSESRARSPSRCARRTGATSRPRCARAVAIARAFPGIGEVRPYSKEESARPARAVARQRAVARRPAGAAHDRGASLPSGARSISRRCARRWPSRSPARASTIIAAGSTACAPWRRPPSLAASACWS